MQKFLKFLKVFFGMIWVLVLILCHIGLAVSCRDKNGDWFTAAVLILIWWIFTAGTYFIYDSVSAAAYGGKGTYRKKTRPSKTALAGRAVLYALWMLALVFVHLGLLGAYYAEKGWLVWVIMIAVWWAVTIVTYKVRTGRVNGEEAAAKAEYEAQYISEIVVEDELFGKIRFRLDSKFNEMESEELHLPRFGADAPCELTVVNYAECDRERIFCAVRGVYEHKDEILERIYPELLEIAGDYGETDENGEPYTLEALREVTAVYGITVCNFEERFCVDLDLTVIRGTLELGGHAAVASIDPTGKTIEVGWE